MKTKEASEDRPTPPPSDREVVKLFIAEAEVLLDRAKTAQDDKEYNALIHAAEARILLADRLSDARTAREAFVKEAGERFAKSLTEAGEKLAGALNTWYRKTEEHAERDRK